MLELLRQEVVKLTGKRNRLPQLTLVRVRLASLLEQMALGNDTMAGFNTAVQACDLWDHDLNNAGGARKMRLRALWLAGTAFPEHLEQAVNVANGPEATIHLLKDEIKKTNDLEEGNQRLTLTAIMMEVLKTFGKPKRLFFEAMKSVRKWPQKLFFTSPTSKVR